MDHSSVFTLDLDGARSAALRRWRVPYSAEDIFPRVANATHLFTDAPLAGAEPSQSDKILTRSSAWEWDRELSQATVPSSAVVDHCPLRRRIPYLREDRLKYGQPAAPDLPCWRSCLMRRCGSLRHIKGSFAANIDFRILPYSRRGDHDGREGQCHNAIRFKVAAD
jgi:hypothetical protein